MSKDRIYCGSGIEKFDGNLIETTINLSKLKDSEHIFEFNGDKYIKLKVAKKREVDEYGKTHYVEVDTWKPEKINSDNAGVNDAPPVGIAKQDEDLPF